MKDNLRSINNIYFVVCLAILLLNDLYLKAEYHNWLTGKLSDFCGLFVFVSFWSALFPGKKGIIHILTAVLFIIWKSPYSQTFIDAFSQIIYAIHRVVDITDLVALSILPITFFYNPKDAVKLKLNPLYLALLTLVSFCATSVRQPTQRFSQPQFVLFKTGIMDFTAGYTYGGYQVYQLDSVVAIGIEKIPIEKRGPIDDDFHKNQILSELDLLLLRDFKGWHFEKDSLPDLTRMKDALIVNGRTSILLKHDSVIDNLNFKNSRLDGNFKRSSNNHLLIDGKFKNGIEDSIWTYYGDGRKVVERKYFENGELTRTEKFKNSSLVLEQNHQTRNDIIRNKYFHLAILGVLIISVLARLILNFVRSNKKDIIKVSGFYGAAVSLGLPLIILILTKLISSFIPHSYSSFFFGIFVELLMVYISCFPLLLVILYGLKLRNRFDLMLYILLFSLCVVLIEEWIFLRTLI